MVGCAGAGRARQRVTRRPEGVARLPHAGGLRDALPEGAGWENDGAATPVRVAARRMRYQPPHHQGAAWNLSIQWSCAEVTDTPSGLSESPGRPSDPGAGRIVRARKRPGLGLSCAFKPHLRRTGTPCPEAARQTAPSARSKASKRGGFARTRRLVASPVTNPPGGSAQNPCCVSWTGLMPFREPWQPTSPGGFVLEVPPLQRPVLATRVPPISEIPDSRARAWNLLWEKEL